MKIISQSVLVLLLSSLVCFGQQTSVNKAPGEDFFIKLDYPTNVTVGGFDVVQKAKGASASEIVIQVMTSTQRQTTGLKAPLLGGLYYYVVRAWVNVTSGITVKKIYSADSNEVSMTVVVLPTPINMVIQ